jgi:hypothetical protein
VATDVIPKRLGNAADTRCGEAAGEPDAYRTNVQEHRSRGVISCIKPSIEVGTDRVGKASLPPLSLHPAALWQVAMRTSVLASTRSIVLFVIAEGRQKRLKARIEGFPLVYGLKPCLKGLPQFLSRRLHGSSPLFL